MDWGSTEALCAPGRGDRSELAIDFLALDFRGHGRSAGRRGVVRRYQDLVEDLRAATGWATGPPAEPAALPARPFQRRPGRAPAGARELVIKLAGVIASNPSIRIAMPVPPGKLKIGKVLHVAGPLDHACEPTPHRSG